MFPESSLTSPSVLIFWNREIHETALAVKEIPRENQSIYALRTSRWTYLPRLIIATGHN